MLGKHWRILSRNRRARHARGLAALTWAAGACFTRLLRTAWFLGISVSSRGPQSLVPPFQSRFSFVLFNQPSVLATARIALRRLFFVIVFLVRNSSVIHPLFLMHFCSLVKRASAQMAALLQAFSNKLLPQSSLPFLMSHSTSQRLF